MELKRIDGSTIATGEDINAIIMNSGAKGICSFGPVGKELRIGFAVIRCAGEINIKLGCFWGTLEEALQAIQSKYGDDSNYARLVEAAAKTLL